MEGAAKSNCACRDLVDFTMDALLYYTAATLANQCRLYNQPVRVGGCWRH